MSPGPLRAVAGLALLALAGAARGESEPPPSPYAILASRLLDTPPVDAIPTCAPPGPDPRLAPAVRALREGQLEAALELVRSSEAEAGRPLRGGAELGAVLEARAAGGREEQRARVADLERLLEEGGPELVRACLQLEAARLHLRLGRYPEAAAAAGRAGAIARAAPGERTALAEAAGFYRAEALYLSGWRRDADALYRELAHSETPRTAAAARLRVADVVFDVGDRASVLHDYETLLKRARDFGASLSDWGLRASEAALAAGRRDAAARWAERILDVRTDPETQTLVGIRLADVEALGGRALDSRKRLEGIEKVARKGPGATLARVRPIELGVDRRKPEERIATLRAATLSAHRGVAVHAQGVLVRELRSLGRFEEALAAATRLTYEAPPAGLVPHLGEDTSAVLAELAAQARREGACLPYAIALGGRYPILVQHAADLAPFVQLGECYEELGVAALAHRVYRALAVASAGEAAEQVALPLARTALAARDLGVVRTAAAGQIRRAPRVAFQWLLLLGEAERLDGKLERAAELLRGLVQNGQPEGAQLRAVLAFARTLERLPPAPADREILSRAVAQVPAAERERDPTDFGEAALLAAEIERRADRRRAARRLYAAAAETLPPGPVRAQALYWRGALDLDLAAAGSIWERAAGEETGGPWRRLAALESSMADLRRQLGAVAPPDATGAGGAR